MGVLDKLKKNSTVKESSILDDSVYFKDQDMVQTKIPAINIALAGSMGGGLTSGVTVLAGPSKHFKTGFALLMIAAYMEKHKDAACLYYMNEFGAPLSYFESFGIDTSRVFVTPIVNVEGLKHDAAKQFDALERGDKVIVLIDSIGNLASKKEIEDALSGKEVADMTRAKALKSFFRIVTPYTHMKNFPLLVIAHTYKEQTMFPKDIVSGGTGSYYSADTIWILGRQQDKEKQSDKEITGYNFIINVEKSRFVREKSKIPIKITFNEGVNTWSGLLDIAVEGGQVVKHNTKPLTYSISGDDDNKYTETKTNSATFWKTVASNTDFNIYIHKRYKLGMNEIMNDEVDLPDETETFEVRMGEDVGNDTD